MVFKLLSMNSHLEHFLEEQIPQQYWHSFWMMGSGVRSEMCILISSLGNFEVDISSPWEKLGCGTFSRDNLQCVGRGRQGATTPKKSTQVACGWEKASAFSLVIVQLWLPNLWDFQSKDHLASKDRFYLTVISLPEVSPFGLSSLEEANQQTSALM